MSGERRRDTARWLIGNAHGLLTPLLLSALARITSQLLGVGLLVLTADALLRAATGEQVNIGLLAAVLIAIALLKAALRYAEHYAGHWVAFTALQRLRELFFASLIPQAPAATKGKAGAALTETATRDIDRIEVFFAHTFPPAVSAIVTPAAALAWLAVAVDGMLALLLVPFVAAVLLLPAVSAGTVWAAARDVAKRRGAVAAHIGDDVNGTREVLMLGAERRRLASLEQESDALTRARTASGAVQGGRLAAIDCVQAVSLVAIVLVANLTGAGVEAAVFALAVTIGLRGPVRGIDGFTAGFDAAIASAQRLRAIVDAPPKVTDRSEVTDWSEVTDRSETTDRSALPAPIAVAAPRAEAGALRSAHTGVPVSFRNVTFAYPRDPGTPAGGLPPRDVLSDVSLQLPAGEWSYVVGVSGSGKSSLASLLMRAWDPDHGDVLCGKTSIADLPLDTLRSRIAIVDQRPTLLADTVGANVRLAATHASDEQVHDVLGAVGLRGWVSALPVGIDTVLASGRTEVSGGQLQRLALARALLAEPEVLILDEALSQLDEETADEVRQALLARRPGRTTLEITHRVDRVPDDAFVAVIDAGQLVEQGRAAELLRHGGSFHRLTTR